MGTFPKQPLKKPTIMKTYKSKKELAQAALKWGSYGTLRSPKVSNNWNAEITGIYYNEDRDSLWVSIYVQGDSTDEDDSIRYEEFIKSGDVSGTTQNHGFRYRFSESEREEFLKKLSDYIDKENAVPQDVRDRQAKVKRIGSWEFINPAVDKLYDLLRLRYSSYMYKRDPKYDAYKDAEKALYAYIEENTDKIIQMDDNAIHELYWAVLYDAYKKARG